MKRLMAILCGVLLVAALCPATAEAKVADRMPGGVPGFFAGCCLGIRTGLEWNDGAQLHFREWAPLIPWVGIVFAVWNGIDCYNGATPQDWAQKNGANWY